METIDARSMINAAATATAAATEGTAPRPERRQRLSPAALAVANEKVRPAYSPIVIAGAVRIADFMLLSVVGIATYVGYVVPLSGFHWEFIAAILGMAMTAVICFQAADIYQVQIFRGQLRQMTRMISSWAFVFLLFISFSWGKEPAEYFVSFVSAFPDPAPMSVSTAPAPNARPAPASFFGSCTKTSSIKKKQFTTRMNVRKPKSKAIR